MSLDAVIICCLAENQNLFLLWPLDASSISFVMEDKEAICSRNCPSFEAK